MNKPLLTEIMKTETPQPVSEEPDGVEEILYGQSLSAFEAWISSPFWKALTLLLKEQIKRNEEDLIAGDIGIKAKETPGLVYRTNEALRGGIVAMSEMVDTLPGVLHGEVEMAMSKAKEDRHESRS